MYFLDYITFCLNCCEIETASHDEYYSATEKQQVCQIKAQNALLVQEHQIDRLEAQLIDAFGRHRYSLPNHR